MRIIICVVSVLFSVYVAIESLIIANTGATYQISQLEGDGGGGLLLAFLCFIAGLLTLVRFWLAAVVFLVATATAIGVALLYQDSMTMLWAPLPLALSAVSWVLQFKRSKRAQGKNVAESHGGSGSFYTP